MSNAEATTSRPTSRLTPNVRAGAILDRTTIGAMRRFLRRPDPEETERIDVELQAALVRYRSAGWLDDPESFHVDPPQLADPRVRGVSGGPLPFEWVTWESGYEPHPIEPGRARWLSYRENRVARAAVLRHRDRTRPWAVCIHGFGMGRPSMDAMAFRAGRLHHVHGFNVALPVLPLHASRRSNRLSRFAGFPSVDILDNVHGAAQAAWDVRRLLSWIRDQGGERVGVQGMSLGGYATSLVASLDADLAFAGPLIPAADLGRLLLDNGEHADLSDGERSLLDTATQVLRVVAPLEMTPKVAADRRYLVAGTLDGMARPSRHAEPLWEHWGRPPIKWYHGSHAAVFWARGIGTFLDQQWERLGLIEVSSPSRPTNSRCERVRRT